MVRRHFCTLLDYFRGDGMKKKMKMISFLLILILCLGMTIPTYAEDSEGFADEYYRVQDQADLMTDSEES